MYEKNYSGKNTELETCKTMFLSLKIHVAIKQYILQDHKVAYFSSSLKGMAMKGFMTAFFHLLVTYKAREWIIKIMMSDEMNR